MTAELEFIQGESPGRKVTLSAAELSIGRDQGSNIVLTHSSASRNHAKLFNRSGIWHIADLDSSNGTLVNGVRISASPVQLRPGDLIQIGPVIMRFQDPAASAQVTEAWNAGHASQMATTQFQAPHPAMLPAAYGPAGQVQPMMQQHVFLVQGKQNLTWLWVFLCLVALGPCGLVCVGFLALAVLPFVMVIGGLVAGFVGLTMYRRYRGYPGWEGHATKGLVLTIGGFTAAALGILWIFVAWLSPGSGTWDKSSSPPVRSSARSEDLHGEWMNSREQMLMRFDSNGRGQVSRQFGPIQASGNGRNFNVPAELVTHYFKWNVVSPGHVNLNIDGVDTYPPGNTQDPPPSPFNGVSTASLSFRTTVDRSKLFLELPDGEERELVKVWGS